jgi:hypothetical protein
MQLSCNYIYFFYLQTFLSLGLHGFFGVGIFTQESLSSHPISKFISIGYFTALKMKVSFKQLHQIIAYNFYSILPTTLLYSGCTFVDINSTTIFYGKIGTHN